MKVGFAQLNPTVGDLRGNFEKILQSYEGLAAAGAELVVTPELAITGYPPGLGLQVALCSGSARDLESTPSPCRQSGVAGWICRSKRRTRPAFSQRRRLARARRADSQSTQIAFADL